MPFLLITRKQLTEICLRKNNLATEQQSYPKCYVLLNIYIINCIQFSYAYECFIKLGNCS